MAPQFFKAILASKKQLTKDVFELTIRLMEPTTIKFRAGQFMNIKIEDGNPKIMFRSYSIMSTPRNESELKTCIKRVPEGRGSTWLTAIPEGTSLNIMGPIGMFTFKEDPENAIQKTIFVATGTGIAPLKCMIEDQLEKNQTEPLCLIWGFRHEEDIFYTKELDALSEKYSNFTFTITLSQPKTSWTGTRGRVTDWLEKNITSPKNTQVYICGVGAMVTDSAATCEKIGITKENIHFEKYD